MIDAVADNHLDMKDDMMDAVTDNHFYVSMVPCNNCLHLDIALYKTVLSLFGRNLAVEKMGLGLNALQIRLCSVRKNTWGIDHSIFLFSTYIVITLRESRENICLKLKTDYVHLTWVRNSFPPDSGTLLEKK